MEFIVGQYDTMNESVLQIEKITLQAWPAIETEIYDGWILRSSHGYTGRANSVNPLIDSSLPIDEKIAYCEQWYKQRGLEIKFRLNKAVIPPTLDTILEQRGYERYNETIVMCVDLGDFSCEIDTRFHYETEVADDWLADWGSWNQTPSEHITTAKAMLQTIPSRVCFGRISEVALGLGVIVDNHLGLFDIVVHPDHRRQGIGRALVSSLMAWGKAHGAHTSYLQVVANNHPAIHLYRELGFKHHHDYWYRRR